MESHGLDLRKKETIFTILYKYKDVDGKSIMSRIFTLANTHNKRLNLYEQHYTTFKNKLNNIIREYE